MELEQEGLEDLKDAKGDLVPSEWARIHNVTNTPEILDGKRRELVIFNRRLDGGGRHWRIKTSASKGQIMPNLDGGPN